jgi:hypothetical protein
VRDQGHSPLGQLGLVWGLGGVCTMLVSAAVRLAPRAFEPVRDGMSTLEWAAWLGSIAFMAYTEGYKGFQRNFSPRVVARALHLRAHPRPLHVALAPLFCMALFHASRVRLIVAWVVLLGVVTLVTIVRGFPQPWRGIVDAGVIVGLTWGVAAIVVFAVRGLSGRSLPVEPGLPDSPSSGGAG